MLLRFVSVKIHNFLSLGDVATVLEDNGLVLVEGHNNNSVDQAYSNGAGKSSIFNAICWALTGETAQGVSTDIINLYGDGSCEVQLEFYANTDHFIVTRRKTATKSSLKVTKNDKDISGKGVRESSKVFADELQDLTGDLIGNVIILGQGLPHKFSNNTPAGRKELLEKLSKSDFMVEDIKDRLGKRKEELSTKIKGYKDQILTENTKLGMYEEAIADCRAKLEGLEQVSFESIQVLEQQIAKQQAAKESVEQQIAALATQISNATDQLACLNEDSAAELAALNEQQQEAVYPLEQRCTSISAQLEELSFKIQHANDDVCPTCGQKIPNKEHVDEQPLLALQADLKEEYKTLEDQLHTIHQNFQAKRDEIQKKYSSSALRDKISSLNITRTSLQEDVKVSDRQLQTLNTELATLKFEQESYQSSKLQLEQTLNLNIQRKTATNESIVYYNEEMEELTQHLEVVNQMLNLVKRDFRGFLLTNVIRFVQAKVSEYSKVVFGSDSIGFTLLDNNIEITYCSKPYENLSGGEKQKVDLIIQFAIKDMLSQYLNVHCNLLVLDEIFDNLDAVGCQKILDLISTFDDISSVYVISHHADELQISYDSKMVVVKDSSGVSKLR